jgi:hypothetical protein
MGMDLLLTFKKSYRRATLVISFKRKRFDRTFKAMLSPPKPVDRDYDQKTAHSNNCVVHVEDIHWVCRR